MRLFHERDNCVCKCADERREEIAFIRVLRRIRMFTWDDGHWSPMQRLEHISCVLIIERHPGRGSEIPPLDFAKRQEWPNTYPPHHVGQIQINLPPERCALRAEIGL